VLADRNAREDCAEILRLYVSGGITNWDMLSRLEKIVTHDAGVNVIVRELDIVYEDPLENFTFDPDDEQMMDEKAFIENCRSFLYGANGIPKPPPRPHTKIKDWLWWLVGLFSLGLVDKINRPTFSERYGDWPLGKNDGDQ